MDCLTTRFRLHGLAIDRILGLPDGSITTLTRAQVEAMVAAIPRSYSALSSVLAVPNDASMPAAARCQVKFSARRLAELRRCCSGRLTIVPTALAMAKGSVAGHP